MNKATFMHTQTNYYIRKQKVTFLLTQTDYNLASKKLPFCSLKLIIIFMQPLRLNLVSCNKKVTFLQPLWFNLETREAVAYKHRSGCRLVMIPHCDNTGEARWFYTCKLDYCAYIWAFAGSATG
jgi:hypothetical protein